MDYSTYQPGVCNIGGAEVQARKRVAQIGALIFIAFALFALFADFTVAQGAIALLPALIGSIGFVQSRKKFCLAFGLMGTFNFAELGKISKVATREEIATDRHQALLIIMQSTVIALSATGVLLLLLAL